MYSTAYCTARTVGTPVSTDIEPVFAPQNTSCSPHVPVMIPCPSTAVLFLFGSTSLFFSISLLSWFCLLCISILPSPTPVLSNFKTKRSSMKTLRWQRGMRTTRKHPLNRLSQQQHWQWQVGADPCPPMPICHPAYEIASCHARLPFFSISSCAMSVCFAIHYSAL
jgi:hypothetical protein